MLYYIEICIGGEWRPVSRPSIDVGQLYFETHEFAQKFVDRCNAATKGLVKYRWVRESR